MIANAKTHAKIDRIFGNIFDLRQIMGLAKDRDFKDPAKTAMAAPIPDKVSFECTIDCATNMLPIMPTKLDASQIITDLL